MQKYLYIWAKSNLFQLSNVRNTPADRRIAEKKKNKK